ncbi:TPA: DUF551 domain-containing protein [Enterobacter roggenkampii]
MSTITKEWLQSQISAIKAVGITESNTLQAFEIALASLEAEPVCVIDQSNLDYLKSGSDADVWPASRAEMGDVLLYLSATPAPVSVPDDVSGPLAHAYKELTPTFMRNHIDVFERYGIYPDGSAGIQAMRIALDGMNRRAAMLQRVENTESRCTMQPASALDSLPQNADSRCSNSPVFPDGWVMVPVEPTEEMLAELCLVKGWTARALNARYQAMLAAAPKPEA